MDNFEKQMTENQTMTDIIHPFFKSYSERKSFWYYNCASAHFNSVNMLVKFWARLS